MHLYVIISVCLPAELFIVFGLGLENITDWIKWSLSGFNLLAFVGGFELNSSLDAGTDTFGYSYEINKSIGFSVCIILGLWLLYSLLTIINNYRCS